MTPAALSRFAALACALGCAAASADPYDFRLYKLGNTFQGGKGYDLAANAKYRIVMRQLGAAVTAVNLMPPETLGHAAFAVSAELQVVDFGVTPTVSAQEVRLPMEGDFRGPLLIPSVHMRKGLPWSFELGARIGWIEKSRMPITTVELKWAVNEGFTFLPDIGVRAFLTKILNSRDFDLTVGGFDLGLGKQFAIGGMVTLTPYAGWNLAFAGSTSSNIDFDPQRSLAQAEGGQVFRDVYTFAPMRAVDNTHNRFYFGGRFIGGALTLSAEFSYTVIGTFTYVPTGETVAVPGVASFNFALGLDF